MIIEKKVSSLTNILERGSLSEGTSIAVANFGYDDGWSTWHGEPGFPGSQLDNYYDHFPGSYDGYPDDYSNGYDDYGPFDHAGQRNFSLWYNSDGHYDNWRPRRPSPYDRSNGSHFRSGGFHTLLAKAKAKAKAPLVRVTRLGKVKVAVASPGTLCRSL